MGLSAEQKQRFLRPMLVREIGPAGQVVLCASEVELEGAPGSAVAALYLERAGVRVNGPRQPAESPDDVLRGAALALDLIKRELAIGAPTDLRALGPRDEER